MRQFGLLLALITHSLAIAAPAEGPAVTSPAATLVNVHKIWDRAPHNAFTGLARHKDKWFCVFREGRGHVSLDGSIRILTSMDGDAWESAALLTSTNADLRDPKITVTSEGGLMIVAAGAMHPPSEAKHRSMMWFSNDGRNWSEPRVVIEPDQWLWRVAWHQHHAYGVAYSTAGEEFVRLYESTDGKDFHSLVPMLLNKESPNESALVFLPDDRALCLLRRDGKPGHGLLGVASPPYTQWEWKDIGMKIGGPDMIRLPDGRLVAGVRLYDKSVRTALLLIDSDNGRAKEILAFPSGGDSSYPGLGWHDGLLWVSYYSSHEGRTSIYLARVKIP